MTEVHVLKRDAKIIAIYADMKDAEAHQRRLRKAAGELGIIVEVSKTLEIHTYEVR